MARWLSVVFLACLFGLFGWPGGEGANAYAQRAPAGAAQGIGWIEFAELPPEARETLTLIKAGGPFPYEKDGTRFGNRERVLPPRAPEHYTEYTVRTPGERTRGARRIVAAGGDPRTSGEYYYTDDHYKSFRRIREASTGRADR